MFSIPYHSSAQILKLQIPDKTVVLTFDDATASQYSVVAPLLKQYNFNATFFICEFPPNFADTSKYMSWQQIKELDTMGFEIANHTKTHAHVDKITKEQFVDQLEYIEKKCDSLGIEKPSSFAYPGYGISSAAIDVLIEKGYCFSRAGGHRVYDPLTDHPLLLPSWATNADNKAQIMEAFAEAKNGKIVILTIHGVPDIEHPWVNTPPQLFQEYLQYLAENQYNVISVRDLNKYINIEKALTIKPDFSKDLRN
jgi:peptidoglycan/xylan/chitin deacetylase (PgdA/CDA1 family)